VSGRVVHEAGCLSDLWTGEVHLHPRFRVLDDALANAHGQYLEGHVTKLIELAEQRQTTAQVLNQVRPNWRQSRSDFEVILDDGGERTIRRRAVRREVVLITGVVLPAALWVSGLRPSGGRAPR
jgi:hypothetical protein